MDLIKRNEIQKAMLLGSIYRAANRSLGYFKRDCWTDLGNTNGKTETSDKQAYSVGYRELMHSELISCISHLGIRNVQKHIESLCRENIMPFTAPR